MYVTTFDKPWDKEKAYTYKEALRKKAAVDDGHEVGTPNSKWAPATIELDPERPGYRVVIKTLE